jgi:hypothetical protein
VAATTDANAAQDEAVLGQSFRILLDPVGLHFVGD